MKNFLFLSMLAGILSIFAAGCTSITTSDGAQKMSPPEPVTGPYRAVYTHKDVRVAGEGQVNVLFGIFAWGANGFAENSDLSSFSFFPSPANYAKSAAVYDACQKNGADTLLGTRYKLTTTDYFVFMQVKCEVAGFPATMAGVEKLVPFVLGKDQQLIYLEPAAKPIMVK
jgi:hypothetical protein